MRKTLLFILLLANLCAHAQKPEFSVNTLMGFTDVPQEHFPSYIGKKGYKPSEDSLYSRKAFVKVSRDKSVERIVERYNRQDTCSILFQTTSSEEFNALNIELTKSGFSYVADHSLQKDVNTLYQKGSVTIHPQVGRENDRTVYRLLIERKALPRASEINSAEDLLRLCSHEYLAAVFGPANVKKDVFYFTETEMNKCSILFPNTSMQVIFVWKDEVNNRNIRFLMIGRPVRSGSEGYFRSVELSKWKSQQGIYPGMSLRELSQINNQPVLFYGWESEEAGFVLPQKSGLIDFKQTGVQLSCLDCNEDRYYSKTNILSSDVVLKENRRVYVSTMVLVPDR